MLVPLMLAAVLASADPASASVGTGPDLQPDDAPTGLADATETVQPPDPYESQGPLDVETILIDTGRAYLDAWARLERHPAIAAEALLDRLAAIPALGPAERKRLLDILAELKRPEHVPLFAKELRRAVVNADDLEAAEVAANRWRALLTDQGPIAMPELLTLVGDRKIPLEVRSLLIEDLVEVTPPQRAAELVVLVGRGHKRLRRSLRSALVAWAKDNQDAAGRMRTEADLALSDVLAKQDADSRGSSRTTELVWFRCRISGASDGDLVRRLEEIGLDDDDVFALRVAAVRGLGRIDLAAARTALVGVARDQLSTDKRKTQRGEVLGWVALRQIATAEARPVVDSLGLRGEAAPRLASLGYQLGSLPRDAGWLSNGLTNPWPTVRQAALSRVGAPCGDGELDRLARLGGPPRKGGDKDGAVARSATQALGRCGGSRAQSLLVKQLKNDDTGLEQRAEAARQLIKRGGPEGADAVAKVLERGDIERALARRLASALRFAKAPTPRATSALCARLRDGGEVALAAAQTLHKLHKIQKGAASSPCETE